MFTLLLSEPQEIMEREATTYHFTTYPVLSHILASVVNSAEMDK